MREKHLLLTSPLFIRGVSEGVIWGWYLGMVLGVALEGITSLWGSSVPCGQDPTANGHGPVRGCLAVCVCASAFRVSVGVP